MEGMLREGKLFMEDEIREGEFSKGDFSEGRANLKACESRVEEFTKVEFIHSGNSGSGLHSAGEASFSERESVSSLREGGRLEEGWRTRPFISFV